MIFVLGIFPQQSADTGAQIHFQSRPSFKIHLHMNVSAVYQGEGRDEPCVEGIVVGIQVQVQFPDPHGAQYGSHSSRLKRPAPVFFLFHGPVLLLSWLKGIYAKWNEKDPAPEVK